MERDDTILRAYTDQNSLLLNRCWRLLISGVVYKYAGDNYWSTMSSSNPQCSLQICGLIYQSAGVSYWSMETNLNVQNRPKKCPKPNFFSRSSRYNDLTFCENIFSRFTIPLITRDQWVWVCMLKMNIIFFFQFPQPIHTKMCVMFHFKHLKFFVKPIPSPCLRHQRSPSSFTRAKGTGVLKMGMGITKMSQKSDFIFMIYGILGSKICWQN